MSSPSLDVPPAAGPERVGPGSAPAESRQRAWLGFVSRNALWVALLVLVVVLSLTSPTFRNPANLQNVLMQNGIIGIVALGMLVMMISGGFDLSVGAAGSAVAVVGAALSSSLGLPVAIVVSLLIGLAIGTINGLIISRLGINPFIATFALASIITGILLVATNGQSVLGRSEALQSFAYGGVAAIPFLFLAFLVFAVLTHLGLTRTKWGHWIFSAGANSESSFLSGIPVTGVRIGAFVFGGFAVAVAGLLLFGQSAIGQPTGAADWPLQAIAICVIGGTSLSGGIGRVSNVVAAVLLLGVVGNGLNQLGISPYWQDAVTGAIILAAVVADQMSKRSGRAS